MGNLKIKMLANISYDGQVLSIGKTYDIESNSARVFICDRRATLAPQEDVEPLASPSNKRMRAKNTKEIKNEKDSN